MGTCITMFSPKVTSFKAIDEAGKDRSSVQADLSHITGDEHPYCHLHRDSLADGKPRQSYDISTPYLTSEESLESFSLDPSSSYSLEVESLPDAFDAIKLTDVNVLGHRSFDLMPNFNFDKDNLRSCRSSEFPGSKEQSGRGTGLCEIAEGQNTCPMTRALKDSLVETEMIQKGAQRSKRKPANNPEGKTSLHYAAAHGHYQTAAQLIKNGAKVNARNSVNRTPLHEVAIKGQVNIAKLLLENGAKVNSRDGWKLTPLHQAITWKHSKMVRLLLQYGAREKGTHLLQDVIMSNLEPLEEIVRKLIARGADVNATDITGQSPIHIAVRYGHGDIVKLLLEAGADVNKVSRGLIDRNHAHVLSNARKQLLPLKLMHLLQDGWSPLRIALKRKRSDMVVALMNAGANVVICDNTGRFPHHKATSQNSCPSLHHILAHPDCPIDIQDIEGSSAIKINLEDHAKSMVYSNSACGCCRNQNSDRNQATTYDQNANISILLIQHGVDLRDLYIHGYDLLYHICSSKFSYDLRVLQAVLYSGNDLSELLSLSAPSCLNSLYRQNRLDMYEWLYDYTNKPRPLRDLCRHKIRLHLRTIRPGRSIWTAVTSLPLPHSLMDFLLLQELQCARLTRHFSCNFPKIMS